MHTKSSQILAAAAAATCGQGNDCRNKRPLGDEHPERIPEEHLGAQIIHQVGEAGSIVLHNSRSSIVFKNDSKEMQETTSAAAKKKEECVDKDAEILRLIEERRNMPKEEKQRLKDLSKNPKKRAREKKRMKRQQDIERILEEFKGVRNIPGIKSAKKRVLITRRKNEKGECITSRKDIADAFGEFYKRLYEDSEKDNSEHEMKDDKRIPEITSEELQSAISKLKNRHEWKKVKIKVIHKKGDVEDVSNYRPICSLPAMYKLFSTILYGRLYPMLDQNQAEDQAGFRKTYQTTDHLATYRMMEQKCLEWGIKMWTATVDFTFTKAFDSISHNSIWEALLSCNVDHGYVCLLRKIYKDQKASVHTDEESEIFDIQKGSKQGDPMSSLLFNTVLQYSLKDEIQRWQKKKGMGIYLSDQERDCLTNLRFADDVMLFATSKEQMRNMVYEFKKATEKVGLKIHPDKTKILSNQSNMNSNTKRYNKVGEMSIEILTKDESVKYLGQRISSHQQETLEIKSRIRAAWATFHKYRQKLTSTKYLLNHRLRLFDATVSPTLCYAAGTWTPSKEHERMIQSTQRKTRCYDSSSRRKENTKRLRNKILSPKMRKELLKRLKIVALMKKAVMVRPQNLKMMWTVG